MIDTILPSNITVKQTNRDTYTEFYLTAISGSTCSVKEQVGILYEQLIPVVLENEIQIIQEKIHGNASALPEFTIARADILGTSAWDPELPFTYIEGRPLDGQAIVSVQIWGIKSLSDEIEIVTDSNPETPARVWTGKDYKIVYYPRIHGFDESNPDNKPCVTDQCQLMFDRSTSALGRYDLSFHDVARTWIYSKRLLDWYGEFNRIRTEHFEEVGIYSTGKDPVFPASTGIQGRFSDEECFLDLLAVKGDSKDSIEMIPVVTSSRQHQAFGYGSAFSRGMVIKHEGYKTVYISGTASINVLGESTYIGDTEMQTLDTFMNIAAILEDEGGSLKDIQTGMVYCKNQETYGAYKSTLRMLGIPKMPIVCVEADVCRHELLIEIELVAVIQDV